MPNFFNFFISYSTGTTEVVTTDSSSSFSYSTTTSDTNSFFGLNTSGFEYLVTEEVDTDGDGVVDDVITYNYGFRAATDSNGDGIADEVELLTFDDNGLLQSALSSDGFLTIETEFNEFGDVTFDKLSFGEFTVGQTAFSYT